MKRSGVVLVAVLVALLVVTLISATVVRGLAVQSRLARQGQQRLQASYLADSAIDRAKAQLESDADYKGEAWQVTLSVNGTEVTGLATITVKPSDGDSSNQVIHVAARWPNDPIDGVLVEREVETAIDESKED